MKRKKRYPQVMEGEWVYPTTRGYNFACCDCGLVHRLDFDIIVIGNTGAKDNKGLELIAIVPINPREPHTSLGVRMKATRDNRRAGQLRRYRQYKYKEVKIK